MNNQIVPPSELVEELESAVDLHQISFSQAMACAYVAGADDELEACCAWIPTATPWDADQLRTARRPKPPTLKQQALAKLPEHPEHMAKHWLLTPGAVATIRRALEALPDD